MLDYWFFGDFLLDCPDLLVALNGIWSTFAADLSTLSKL
jgi:hypothetical protein